MAGAEARSPSVPPSKACRLHILHLVNNAPKCKFGDKDCKFDHPKKASKEDEKWAKARKDKPRAPSPAAGARSSSGGSGKGNKQNRKKR